jgi:ornithine cyclodeaminase/alanine dehydrogenase-like protein (mu-crystallin family)
MKVIDFETVKNISNNIKPSEFYDWIDDALKNKDSYVMPSKTRIGQRDGDYYAVMPCMNEEENFAMVKMIGRHALHEGECRSTMMSDMLLYEADTGILKALMDGEYITTIRTGAAAAHAALMYGKKDFSTIGLIGLGNIMTVCIEVLLSKIDNREVTIKLFKHHNQEQRFAERFLQYKNVKFIFCDTYEETIRNSDIIVSAVTRVTENFCTDDCYSEGCTVIPIMTMGFQNCDLFFDKVFTDEIEQIRGFRYFDFFRSVTNTTDVLNGFKEGRKNDKERILVYYYGLAIYDLYFASELLKRAEKLTDIDYKYCKEKYFI